MQPEDYPETPLRPVVLRLFDEDPAERELANRELREHRDYAPGESEAHAILELTAETDLPESDSPYSNPKHDLLFLIINAPHGSIVDVIDETYDAYDERSRTALLALLGATRTRAGAEAFMRLLQEHGWPEGVYARVFMEIEPNSAYASVYFPALITFADQYLMEVGRIALRWLQDEAIRPELLSNTIGQLVSRLQALLDQARTYAGSGIAWMFQEGYFEIRAAAGFLLDFLGWFDQREVRPVLERAAESRDPWLALFASTSLIRLGEDVSDAILERVASSSEARGHLWQYLENLGELHRYPNEWAELEHFAAFDMVQWLKYPTELGRVPDEIELMETIDGQYFGESSRLFVWRFKGFDDEWTAAVSGPYDTSTVGPVAGPSTFSRFDAWDSASAEEHAEAVLETLAEWRRADS